jgi:hypothetical protein
MGNNKTTEEFVKQAKEVHNGRYDYSFVKYVNWKTKIEIICSKHGIFKQTPNHHLEGQGCRLCNNEKMAKAQSSNTGEFIDEANKKHNFKYDYSLVDYANRYTKINIICKEHGCFLQSPGSHLNGAGCPKCGREQTMYNTNEFLEKAKEIHGDRYDYSLVVYKGMRGYVDITCKNHGVFKQVPVSHLSGGGCPFCFYDKYKLSLSEFIEKAINVHGTKYDYSLVNYVNSITKVKIICPAHGIFKQKPNNHLQGQNCPRCSNVVSKPCDSWLNSLGIPNDPIHREVKNLIPGRKYIADGYSPENNTIYEFYGDKIHGNPLIYKMEDISSINKKTFGECYRKTMEKEKAIKDAGYNLISIWESEFKQQQIDRALALV